MTRADPYLVQETNTATFDPSDSTDFWAEHVCRNHGTLQFRFADQTTFRGGTTVQRYIDHQLVDFWSEGIIYSRQSNAVRRDADEHARLIVPTAGTIFFSQDGITTQVQPGRAVLGTKARPFDLGHSTRARAWIMNVSAGIVPPDSHTGPATFDVAHGLGSVLGNMITELGAQRNALDGATFSSVCDTVTDLLPLCLRPRPELPSTLAAVDAATRDYVRRHAVEPDLTPEAIARALGWSLRQVQLALHHTGTTPAALIRNTRLDVARTLLRQAPAQRTIADIAYSSGFRSLSAFGAAFKAQYGLTPQEARGR